MFPRYNTVLSNMPTNDDFNQLFEKDRDYTTHTWNDIIKEYNNKYAGKVQTEVDAEERRQVTRIMAFNNGNQMVRLDMGSGEMTPIDPPSGEEYKANYIKEIMNPEVSETGSYLTIPKEFIFETHALTYCGLHNTVDDGGCKQCQKQT